MAGPNIESMTKDALRAYALSNHGIALDMSQRVADLRKEVEALDSNRASLPDSAKPKVEDVPVPVEVPTDKNPPFVRNKTSGKIYPWHANYDMKGQWDPVWPEG